MGKMSTLWNMIDEVRKKIACFLIILAYLLGGAGSVAAAYKKKVFVEPLENPVNWSRAFDAGALVAKMIQHSIAIAGKYQLVPAARPPLEPPPSSGEDEEPSDTAPLVHRHPAQVLIQGRVLTFKTKSETQDKEPAKVEVELVLKDAFTQKTLAAKKFRSEASHGRMLFQAPAEGGIDLDGLVFRKSAMGKALTALIHKAIPFVDSRLDRVPFIAWIISVDADNEEVIVNAGKNHGLRSKEKLYIYSMDLNFMDPLSRHNLGEKVALQGVVKVKDVLDNYSVGEIVAGEDFKAGFAVVPRFKLGHFPVHKRSWREFYGVFTH